MKDCDKRNSHISSKLHTIYVSSNKGRHTATKTFTSGRISSIATTRLGKDRWFSKTEKKKGITKVHSSRMSRLSPDLCFPAFRRTVAPSGSSGRSKRRETLVQWHSFEPQPLRKPQISQEKYVLPHSLIDSSNQVSKRSLTDCQKALPLYVAKHRTFLTRVCTYESIKVLFIHRLMH